MTSRFDRAVLLNNTVQLFMTEQERGFMAVVIRSYKDSLDEDKFEYRREFFQRFLNALEESGNTQDNKPLTELL